MRATSKVTHHLGRLYPQLEADALGALATRVIAAAALPAEPTPGRGPLDADLPGADEVILISYGDTFLAPQGGHLRALGEFWHEHLSTIFSTLHVLPFFPSSSDGGFAVIDYRRIADELGDWSDLARVVGSRRLMVDLVCNHGSAQSEWFDQFTHNQLPGRDYYLTADPDADLAMVTRPRTHPLLLPVETATGEKHVWATFSHDQVDFDFANPDVLVEFCAILGFYLAHGATRIRLDAIAYLWKQIGTTCVHLPQTHQVVKLMRLLVDAYDPHALIITETNVPHAENVSYFGDGEEAQVVYNFTLAPLIVWSLVTGGSETMTDWLDQLTPPPPGCTFLNFIASHDGLGLRPIEDLITFDALSLLIDAATEVGGSYSAYSTAAGPRPYELNVSLADLLAGPDGETADRYVVAHAVMLALQGIPAIYVHSMLSSPGDTGAVAASGHKRDINRSRLALDEAQAVVAAGWRAQVFNRIAHLITTRGGLAAFDPAARQAVHRLHPHVLAVERGHGVDRVLAVHNLSPESVQITLPEQFGETDMSDVLTGDVLVRERAAPTLTLTGWQARWLV